MPASSQKQRGLMAAALAYKSGKKQNASPAVKRAAEMSTSALKDFVHAPLGNLPVRSKPKGRRHRKG